MLKKCTISALAVLVTLSLPASMIAQANTVPTQSQESQTNKLMQAKQGGKLAVQSGKTGTVSAILTAPAKISDIFPDPVMSAYVASELGKAKTDEVTQADLDTITLLRGSYTGNHVAYQNITSFEGVQYLRNVTAAAPYSLKNKYIPDLTPFLGMTKLQTLVVSGDNLTQENVDIIGQMSNLDYIEMAGCSVKDISALASLNKLKTLDVNNNNISDFSPLSGLTQLTTVKGTGQTVVFPEMEDNITGGILKVKNPIIGPAGMTAGITGTDVSFASDDISWSNRTGTTGTASAAFNYTGKNGWSYSGTLTQPWKKSPVLGTISEVFPDPVMSAYVATEIGKVKTDEVTQADLDAITLLRGSYTGNHVAYQKITSFEGVQYLRNVTSAAPYSLTNKYIPDLTPFLGMTKLQTLVVSGDNLTQENVDIIGQMSNLDYIEMAGCSVKDISALASLNKLKTLDVNNNNISDFSPLSGLTQLASVKGTGQTIVLPEVEDNVTGNVLSVDNPIVGVTGMTPTFGGTDVSYDSATNKIKWINRHLPGTNTVTATFNYTGKPGWTFGGSASQTYTRAASLGTIADVFPDQNLANIIATTLGKQVTDTVTHLDLETITDLDASDKEIHELTGMEKLTNLATTQLDGNNITDITPLLNLTQLTSVDITNQTVVFELVIEPLTNGVLSVPNILQLPTGASLEVNGADVSYDNATNKVAWANVTAQAGDLEASFTMNDLPTGWSYSGLIQQAYEKDSLAIAQAEVERLFKDTQKKELASGITDVDIRQADEAVEGLANEADKVPLRADVILAWDLLHNGKATAAVNALFTNEDPAQDIKDDLVQTDIDDAQALVDAINASHSADVKTDLQTKVAKAQAQLTAKEAEAEAELQAEEAVYQLFENNDPVKNHPKDNLTQTKIDDAQSLVDGLKTGSVMKSVLQQSVNRVQILLDAELARETTATNALNALFMNNDSQYGIKDGLAQSEIDDARALVNQVYFSTPREAAQELLDIAQEELDARLLAEQIEQDARTAMDALFVNQDPANTVRDDVTLEEIAAVQVKIDLVMDEQKKDAMTAELKAVRSQVLNNKLIINPLNEVSDTVSGFTKANAKIRVYINGVAKNVGTTDADGAYSLVIGHQDAGTKVSVEVYDSVKRAYVMYTTVTVEGMAPELTVNALTNADNTLTGTATPGVKIRVMINDVAKCIGYADAQGNYSIIIGYQTKDTKIGVEIYDADVKKYVGHTDIIVTEVPFPLTINPVASTDTEVTGTTEANGKIRVYINDVVKTLGYADASGNYRVTIGKKVVGTKVGVEVYNSQTKAYVSYQTVTVTE
ncbi:toxin Cry1Ac domain D-VI-related protein [Listeria booriae]|uniref:Leucine-rich repeat domain-containing protein n=1 Tax=Listeria booriae TaxID=1552123 RepID=A0A841ZTB9_9LIST|nr:toxin Cry1Ac domain D-VI-related protein [Listeria booriae]MBC1565098.1 leucine-rich repeat domain-containing protein [Listeria booriae]